MPVPVSTGVYKSGIAARRAASDFDTRLTGVNMSWLNSMIGAINHTDTSKVKAITDVFNATKSIGSAIKEATKITKAFELTGASGSRFANVGEAYDYLTKKEDRRKAFDARIADFTPASWIKRYEREFGDDANQIANLEFGDEIASITNLKELHRVQTLRRWGYDNGGRILQAEHDEAIRKSKKERHREQLLGQMRYRHDMMDDYEQSVYELGKSYGGGRKGRRLAENKLRNDAVKGLPKFMQESLKNSRISTKSLVQLTKGAKTTPILGKILTQKGGALGAAGLGIEIAAIVIGLMKLFNHQVDKANEKSVSWENARNLYGNGSSRFNTAAYLVGMKDPRKISELYGKLTTEYGDADEFIKQMGMAMRGMSKKEKTFFASSMGLDADTVALADIYNQNMKLSGNRKTQALVNMGEVVRTEKGTTDASVMDNIVSMIADPSVGARLIDRNEPFRDFEYFGSKKVKRATEAAKSGDNYEAQGSSTTNVKNVGGRTVSFNIGTIELQGVQNKEQFIRELESGSTLRGYRTVVDTFDSGMKA